MRHRFHKVRILHNIILHREKWENNFFFFWLVSKSLGVLKFCLIGYYKNNKKKNHLWKGIHPWHSETPKMFALERNPWPSYRLLTYWVLLWWLSGKESTCNAQTHVREKPRWTFWPTQYNWITLLYVWNKHNINYTLIKKKSSLSLKLMFIYEHKA